jgi:predicted metalloprotease with PDZ domain
MSVAVIYELHALDMKAHEFTLRIQVPDPLPEGQRLQLPSWIPGSYMIRDFARNITEIQARDDRGAVPLRKIDKQTWEAASCEGPLFIDYRVYAFDLSVRSAYLDQTRAYFNGTSVFLCLPDRRDAPWELRIAPPTGAEFDDWRVATSLPAADVNVRGFGLYAGQGYERLVDCPVEIGVFARAEFRVEGVPHGFVVSDGGCFDMDRICADLKQICAEHEAMFGGLPVSRYLFLTLATGDGYGGLEHCDSTSLMCKRSDLPVPGMDKVDKGYRQFLGLCSHEYFHLWNVKRIRPARLAEADLLSEAYTELLWAFEGITSYYDELALARSSVLSSKDYLDLFATTVTRVLRTPGRTRQSVAESSFDAWTKFYKQDANAPNAIVSYYAKGALVAFGLDVTIRQRSGDTLCLDDLMRRLWQRFGKADKGVPERAIEREVATLLGEPLQTFFDQFIYGTDELPLPDWFAALGVGYRPRAPAAIEDLGGYREEAPEPSCSPSLGARLDVQSDGLRFTHVIAGGAAQAAGLSSDDRLVAIGGERVTAANINDLLKRMPAEGVEVHYFRRDRLAVTMLPSFPSVDDTCDLWFLPDSDLSPDVVARRTAWLRSSREQAG